MFAIRRPNTIELSLPTSIRRSREIVSRDDVIKSINAVLGNDSRTSIQCIQRATNGMSYRVTFKPESLRPRESLLTKGIYLKGTFCYFMGAEATYQVITVSNVPFEVSDAGVQAFFETYGEVREIIRNKDKYGFETGDRRLLMVLGHHIPASVFLDPFTAHVKYRNQPLCCYHCNWWGHTNRNCPLEGRCGKCGSRAHHTYACQDLAVDPPAYSVGRSDDDAFEVHPAVEWLRRAMEPTASELFGSDHDVESNHTNDIPTEVEGPMDVPAEQEPIEQEPIAQEPAEQQESEDTLSPQLPSHFPHPISQDSLANVPLATGASVPPSPASSQWSCSLGTVVPTPSFSNVVLRGPLLGSPRPAGVATAAWVAHMTPLVNVSNKRAARDVPVGPSGPSRQKT
jgi:hypothetical protein